MCTCFNLSHYFTWLHDFSFILAFLRRLFTPFCPVLKQYNFVLVNERWQCANGNVKMHCECDTDIRVKREEHSVCSEVLKCRRPTPLAWLVRLLNITKNVTFSHTRYRALGPELIPVYRQSARTWREVNHAIDPAVGCHYFLPGLRLPP